jgi:hypothetical protein
MEIKANTTLTADNLTARMQAIQKNSRKVGPMAQTGASYLSGTGDRSNLSMAYLATSRKNANPLLQSNLKLSDNVRRGSTQLNRRASSSNMLTPFGSYGRLFKKSLSIIVPSHLLMIRI